MSSYLAIIKVVDKNRYDNLMFNNFSMKAAVKRVAIHCYYEYGENDDAALLISKKYSKYLENQENLIIQIQSTTGNKRIWKNRKVIDEDLFSNWSNSFKEANDEYERQMEEDEIAEKLGVLPERIEKQFNYFSEIK